MIEFNFTLLDIVWDNPIYHNGLFLASNSVAMDKQIDRH